MIPVVEIIGRLRTITDIEILDCYVPKKPPDAYVVFYDDAPEQYPSRAVAVADRARYLFRVVCVGRDANETRSVVAKVQAMLTNWRIPNTNASWLSPQPDGAPILRDDEVASDIRFSQTLVYAVHTSRSNP